MPPTSSSALIRQCVERFASDLTHVMTRAALDAVSARLAVRAGPPRRPAPKRTLERAPRAVSRTAAAPKSKARVLAAAALGGARESDVPITLRAYQRQAILRALSESRGNPVNAGAALGLSKSSIYRQMAEVGIPRARSQVELGAIAPHGYLRLPGPVSLDSYEKRALQRALEAAGGDKRAAARALEIGVSTFYRRCGALGLL